MNHLSLLLFCLVLFSGLVAAQDNKITATPPPTTALETFQAKTGTVIIRGFSKAGTMRGLGGTIEVSSRELASTQSNQKAYGILIEVKETSRLTRESRSYIDLDEVDSLLSGIDYIAKIDKSATKLNDFEASYRTKDDFSVTTFNDADGISVAISSGRIGRVSVYLKLAELPQFRKLIADAKANLDLSKLKIRYFRTTPQQADGAFARKFLPKAAKPRIF